MESASTPIVRLYGTDRIQIFSREAASTDVIDCYCQQELLMTPLLVVLID